MTEVQHGGTVPNWAAVRQMLDDVSCTATLMAWTVDSKVEDTYFQMNPAGCLPSAPRTAVPVSPFQVFCALWKQFLLLSEFVHTIWRIPICDIPRDMRVVISFVNFTLCEAMVLHDGMKRRENVVTLDF